MSTDRPDNWPKWIRDPLPVDWPEDAADEDNGCYQRNCVHCRVLFFGHKRRPTCKECATAQQARWDALTPEQKAAEIKQHEADVVRFLASR